MLRNLAPAARFHSPMILTILLLLLPSAIQEQPAPELVFPTRHADPIVAPNGQHVLLLDHDHAWLLDAGELTPRLGLRVSPSSKGGDHWTGARFSRDGRRLALWSFRGASAVLDAEAARVLGRWPAPDHSGYRVCFTDPDVQLLGSIDGELLRVHDLIEDRALYTGSVQGGACFSDDGHWLFVAHARGVERLDPRRPAQRSLLAPGHWETITPLAGGALLLTRADRVTVRGRGARADPERALEGGPWRLDGVSADGGVAVLCGSGERLRALDLADLSTLWELEGWHSASVPRGASVVWARGRDGQRQMHDLVTGEPLWEMNWEGPLREPGQTPTLIDGALLLPMARGGLARVDCRTGELQPPWRHYRRLIEHAGVFSSGEVWAADAGGGLICLDARRGEVLSRRELNAPIVRAGGAAERLLVVLEGAEGLLFEGPALEQRWSLAGARHAQLLWDGERLVAFGGDIPGVQLLRAQDGALLRAVGTAEDPLRRVVASADGALLAALDDDWRPHLWRDGVPVPLGEAARNPRSIALDPAGRWLALGSEPPQVQVFDAATGLLQTSFEPNGWFPFGGDIRTLMFDRTGARLIATTGDYGTLQVWNTGDWKRAWEHDYGGGNPSSLVTALDPAGKNLWVHGMTDHTARAFELASGRTLADLAGSGLYSFGPGEETVTALRDGALVLLEPDGHVRLQYLDFGNLGAVTLRGSELSGPPAALSQIFVRVAQELVRGDEYARELEGDGKR